MHVEETALHAPGRRVRSHKQAFFYEVRNVRAIPYIPHDQFDKLINQRKCLLRDKPGASGEGYKGDSTMRHGEPVERDDFNFHFSV